MNGRESSLRLKLLDTELSVCRLSALAGVDLDGGLYFISRTDQELSLVCPSDAVPGNCLDREDGWLAFRAEGVLDFSLVGILAGITAALAGKGIAVFAVSTFNTDYILVKKDKRDRAVEALTEAGYTVL